MEFRRPLSSFWLAAWALTLALGWLLPNHYPPWSAFHFDAWVSLVLLVGSAAVVLATRVNVPTRWDALTVMVAVLVLVPGLQYYFGLVLFGGTAWVGTGYLLGFLLALLVGARWELCGPGQLADGLFLAIGIAAVLSVGMQMHQFLQLTYDDWALWSMGPSVSRPHSNFGQPNQLGTFLIWGLAATGWGLLRRHMRVPVAVMLALFLLFGVAMTQSRTSWLGLIACLGAIWMWRSVWPSRWVPASCAALFGIFLTYPAVLRWLSQVLLTGSDVGMLRVQFHEDTRLMMWRQFIHAALEQPFFGFGWYQGSLAQLASAVDYPSLHGVYSHSHNLFLDLVLWCGIPGGLLVVAMLLAWFWRQLWAVRDAECAVLMLFLIAVGIHAMLELPLHYAYMLLPTGLVMGVLNTRHPGKTIVSTGRWVLVALWLASAVLLVLVVRDYFRVEASYQVLRFEWARIKTKPEGPPDVMLLTQWREFVRYARFDPGPGMTAEQLQWMRRVTSQFPSAGNFQKMAAALASNGQPDEARSWLRKACKMVSDSQCAALKAAWEDQALHDPRIAAVPWPN